MDIQSIRSLCESMTDLSMISDDSDSISNSPSILDILCYLNEEDRMSCRFLNRRFFLVYKNNFRRFPRQQHHLQLEMCSTAKGNLARIDVINGSKSSLYYVTNRRIRVFRVMDNTEHEHLQSKEVRLETKDLDAFGNLSLRYLEENDEHSQVLKTLTLFEGTRYDDYRMRSFREGLRVLLRMLFISRDFTQIEFAKIMPDGIYEAIIDSFKGSLCKFSILHVAESAHMHAQLWKLALEIGCKSVHFHRAYHYEIFLPKLIDAPVDRLSITMTYIPGLKWNNLLNALLELFKKWQSCKRRILRIEVIEGNNMSLNRLTEDLQSSLIQDRAAFFFFKFENDIDDKFWKIFLNRRGDNAELCITLTNDPMRRNSIIIQDTLWPHSA